jgi:hypothetical protein
VGSPALTGQSHRVNPHASTLIGQSQRVSPHASAPTRQPPRVSRLACMAAHVTRMIPAHAFPRSCVACGIRPFDHHHQPPSDAASGSAVRPMKVAARSHTLVQAEISCSAKSWAAPAAPLARAIAIQCCRRALYLRAQRAITCLDQPVPSPPLPKTCRTDSQEYVSTGLKTYMTFYRVDILLYRT